MRLTLFLIAATLASAAAHADGPRAGDGGWAWQNPLPTASMLHGIHFVSPTTGWAIGEAGTILRTDDAGATWRGRPSGADAILLSGGFADAARGWVIGYRFGVYGPGTSVLLATRDGGATWLPQDPIAATDLFGDVFFLDPMHGWLVGENGAVRRTENGGQTWSLVPTGVGALLADVFFADPLHGWIVGGDNGDPSTNNRAYLRTTDGGTTWTGGVTIPGTPLTQVQFLDAASGWAADLKGALLHSADGGETWAPVATPDTVNSFRFLNARTGFLNGQSLWRTDDGGATWKHLPWHTDGARDDLTFLDTLHGFSLTGGIPYRTEDGGNTWTPLFPKSPRPVFQAVSFPASREGWALIGNGVMWHTTDAGEHWSPAATGFPTAYGAGDIAFPDALHGWIVGGGGTILHTSDGGASWQAQASGSTETFCQVVALDADHAWARGTDAFVRTRDAGRTWEPLPPGGPVNFVDSDVGFRVAENVVQRTGDGGLHWSDVATLDANYVLGRMDFQDANNGLLGGYDYAGPDAPRRAALLRTRDGGKTWREEAMGAEPNEQVNAVRLFGDDDEWALASGHEYRTTDSGRTWTRHWLGASALITDVDFPDAMNGWAVGTEGTILHTRTAGLLPGDVNADGDLNTADAARALAVVGGLNPDAAQADLADADGDGRATLSDVVEILRHPTLPRETLEGTLSLNRRSGFTPYGTHTLRDAAGATTALLSASLDLRAYEGKTVRVTGRLLPGYPLQGWPYGGRMLNVTWIREE